VRSTQQLANSMAVELVQELGEELEVIAGIRYLTVLIHERMNKETSHTR